MEVQLARKVLHSYYQILALELWKKFGILLRLNICLDCAFSFIL